MCLLFNMLSRLVITFLPRSKRLLISWLQSPSAVILEPKKIKFESLGFLNWKINKLSKDSYLISGIFFFFSVKKLWTASLTRFKVSTVTWKIRIKSIKREEVACKMHKDSNLQLLFDGEILSHLNLSFTFLCIFHISILY